MHEMLLGEGHRTDVSPQGLRPRTSDRGLGGKLLQLRPGRAEEIWLEFPPQTRAISRGSRLALPTAVLLMRRIPAGQEAPPTRTAVQLKIHRPNASIGGGTRTVVHPSGPFFGAVLIEFSVEECTEQRM